jgi:branched-chain amino acid transport system ATP-binding protein
MESGKGDEVGHTGGVLSCEAVTVRFGALTALDNVSLAFPEVGIHSVIGPNGAGKTTLINVLSGRQRPSSGKVRLDGRDITSTQAFERARSGIGRSFQITKIFPTLSVFENLRLAAQAQAFGMQPFWRRVQGYPVLAEAAAQAAIDIGLQGLEHAPAEQLSHGDQRALELGITLMTEPRILLLDEPLAGVGEREIDRMMGVIERVSVGRTVILIEHNIDVVMKVSRRIVVMDQGAVLSIGTPAEVRDDPGVRRAYLGDDDAGA